MDNYTKVRDVALAAKQTGSTQPLVDMLEALVDTHTLADVLRALATVCDNKHEHIAHAWQDAATARDWGNIAPKLVNLSDTAKRWEI